jgi:hypothetical protein
MRLWFQRLAELEYGGVEVRRGIRLVPMKGLVESYLFVPSM